MLFLARTPALSRRSKPGSDVTVDHPLLWHQVRLFMLRSLQELPWGTTNVVCLHCGTTGHLVGVHHLLVVDEGNDHQLQPVHLELFLDGAWPAFSSNCLNLFFVSEVCIGIAYLYIVIMLPPPLPLSVIIERCRVSPLFFICSAITPRHPSGTLLCKTNLLMKNEIKDAGSSAMG
jgi:hypothetical protein